MVKFNESFTTLCFRCMDHTVWFRDFWHKRAKHCPLNQKQDSATVKNFNLKSSLRQNSKTHLKACGPSVSQFLLKSSNKVLIESRISTIWFFLARSFLAISKNLIFSSSSTNSFLPFFSRLSLRPLSEDVRRPFFSLFNFLTWQKFYRMLISFRCI